MSSPSPSPPPLPIPTSTVRRIPWGRTAAVLWVVMFAKNLFAPGLPPAVVWASLVVDVVGIVALGAWIAVWATTKSDAESGLTRAAKRLVPALYVLGVLAVIWFTAALIFGAPSGPTGPTADDTAQLVAERDALVADFRMLAPRAGQCLQAIDAMLVEDVAIADALRGAYHAGTSRRDVNDLLRDQIRLYEGAIQDLQDCMAGSPS